MIEKIIQTNAVEKSHRTKIINSSVPFQNLPDIILQNNNMSIQEDFFSSTISSSSNNSDIIQPA